MIVQNKDQTHSYIGRSFTGNGYDLIKLREWRGHPDSGPFSLKRTLAIKSLLHKKPQDYTARRRPMY